MKIICNLFIFTSCFSLFGMDKEKLEIQYMQNQIEVLKEQLRRIRIQNEQDEQNIQREAQLKELDLLIQEQSQQKKLDSLTSELNLHNKMIQEKNDDFKKNKIHRHLAQGFFQAVEAAPQVATQVAVQTVANELTQLGIEKVKELFDADLRETKEFVAIMSKLKQTTEKFQILIDSMNSAHKQNLELLKRNPEDATIKEMVQKTEAEMLIKKKKLLQRHNQLVSLYTNKLVNLACQDTEKKEQPIITPQRVVLGGVATAAVVAGFTYLRK